MRLRGVPLDPSGLIHLAQKKAAHCAAFFIYTVKLLLVPTRCQHR